MSTTKSTYNCNTFADECARGYIKTAQHIAISIGESAKIALYYANLNTPFTVSNTPATGRQHVQIADDIAEQAANDIKRVCSAVESYHGLIDDDDVADPDADAACKVAISTAREHANEAKQHAITARQRYDQFKPKI